MKVTKQYLRKLIKEEVAKSLNESDLATPEAQLQYVKRELGQMLFNKGAPAWSRLPDLWVKLEDIATKIGVELRGNSAR